MDSPVPATPPPAPPAAPFQYWVPPPLGGFPPQGRDPVVAPTSARRPTASPTTAPRAGRPTKRRHKARRSRIAAAVVSTGAFVALVGCAAFSDSGATSNADNPGASQIPSTTLPSNGSPTAGPGAGANDPYGSGYSTDPGTPPDWSSTGGYGPSSGTDTTPFGGSAVPGGSSSSSSGPSTSSHGS